VAPSLQLVGYVERIERVGIGVVESLEEFEKILRLIQERAGDSPLSLISSIKRFYNLSTSSDTCHPRTLEEYISDTPDFQLRFSSLLQEIQFNSAEDFKDRRELVLNLAALLGLGLDDDGSLNPSRTTYTAGGSVGPVRCHTCNMTAVPQLHFYYGKTFDPHPNVYRIPGLGYNTSYYNGVGLIISNNRILGRIVLEIPACECKVIGAIEIH
jgi:hypothetical protein